MKDLEKSIFECCNMKVFNAAAKYIQTLLRLMYNDIRLEYISFDIFLNLYTVIRNRFTVLKLFETLIYSG